MAKTGEVPLLPIPVALRLPSPPLPTRAFTATTCAPLPGAEDEADPDAAGV